MPNSRSSSIETTKARRIFLDLRSRILSGELPANSKLTLRPLARQYGTGINAVSEAVKALGAEGLIELNGQAGAKVHARDLPRIRGEYILRIAIETEAARRCAVTADDAQFSYLAQLADEIDALILQGDHLEKCRQLDVQFHLSVAEFSGVLQLRDALLPRLQAGQ